MRTPREGHSRSYVIFAGEGSDGGLRGLGPPADPESDAN